MPNKSPWILSQLIFLVWTRPFRTPSGCVLWSPTNGWRISYCPTAHSQPLWRLRTLGSRGFCPRVTFTFHKAPAFLFVHFASYPHLFDSGCTQYKQTFFLFQCGQVFCRWQWIKNNMWFPPVRGSGDSWHWNELGNCTAKGSHFIIALRMLLFFVSFSSTHQLWTCGASVSYFIYCYRYGKSLACTCLYPMSVSFLQPEPV